MASNIEQTKKSVIDALGRVPDFPKAGINFIDILPIFQSPTTFSALLDVLEHMVKEQFGTNGPDVLVGLEARGFLFGPSLALRLGASFVPVRKQGKMPGKCLSVSYTKEYGDDVFEIQEGAVKPGQKVLIVDDIIATGGTAIAAAELVEKSQGNLLGFLFMIELSFLKGREKLGLSSSRKMLTLLEDIE